MPDQAPSCSDFDSARRILYFSFISPLCLLVLCLCRRSMMRCEHAVSLFTETTSNLTFKCPSAVYMNSYYPRSVLLPVTFLSQYLTWHAFLLCFFHSPSFPFFPILSLNHFLLLESYWRHQLYACFFFIFCFSFHFFLVSSKVCGRLRSSIILFELEKRLFSHAQISSCHLYHIYLHPPLIPSSPWTSISSSACLMLFCLLSR